MTLSLKWQLSHAVGYMQLGMFAEAEAELDAIEPLLRDGAEALAVRVELYHHSHNWEKLFGAAQQLVLHHPSNPGGWVSSAYALRRLEDIEAARKILLEGEESHPDDPTIKFNLGCYAAQLGELDAAEFYVRAAIALDGTFKSLAQNDPDLDPLRQTGLNFL